MRLIVSSKEDPASQNILDSLLERGWDEVGEWKGNPVYRRQDDYIASVNEHHIYVDDIAKDIQPLIDGKIDMVVFISKHSSEAGIHSLTVHPIGNYGNAKFGGVDNNLVPVPSRHMSTALRTLWDKARDASLQDEYEVSFEATHHGPYLETPTYYIEIGSEIDSWEDERAGEVIASTLLESEEKIEEDHPAAFCIGGGHYAPKFTDLARKKRVSIGHMVPGWALDDLDMDSFEEAVVKSDADLVYLDEKNVSRKDRKRIDGFLERTNLDVKRVRKEDLDDR